MPQMTTWKIHSSSPDTNDEEALKYLSPMRDIILTLDIRIRAEIRGIMKQAYM